MTKQGTVYSIQIKIKRLKMLEPTSALELYSYLLPSKLSEPLTSGNNNHSQCEYDHVFIRNQYSVIYLIITFIAVFPEAMK